MTPADERLDARERRAPQRDDRLEVERELVVGERGGKLVLEPQPPHRLLVRALVGHAPGRGPTRARAAGCGVRVAQQRRGAAGAVECERQADGRVQSHAGVLEDQRLARGGGERLCARERVGARADRVGEDDDALAREAHHRGAVGRDVADAGLERRQRLLARRMAEGAVDAPHVLAVDEQHRQRRVVAPRAIQRAADGGLRSPPHPLVLGRHGHGVRRGTRTEVVIGGGSSPGSSATGPPSGVARRRSSA